MARRPGPACSRHVRRAEERLLDLAAQDVVDVGQGGIQVVLEVRDDQRRLVQQQGLHLAGQLHLRVQVDGGDELLVERVQLRVLEMGCVPHALAGERGLEHRVGHAAPTVVDQAHLPVEPVGVAERRLAVIEGLGLDLEGDVDPRLLGAGGERLGQLRDLLELLGEHRGVDPRGVAGRAHQLLGLGHIQGALRDRLVGRGEDRRERAVIAQRAVAAEQRLDHPRAIRRQRHRLPDPGVVERRLVGPHRQLAMQRGRDLDDLVGGVVEQRARPGRRQGADHVDLAALERQDHRRLALVEGPRGPGQLGLGAPVIGVGHEVGADVLGVALELERPRPDHRLLPRGEVGCPWAR